MASVKFYLKNPKEKNSLKKTDCKIYLMFSLGRKLRFPIPTGESVQPKYWNFIQQEVKPAHRSSIAINSHLSEIKSQALDVWRKNKLVDPERLKLMIRVAVTGEKSGEEKKTALSILSQMIEQYEREKDIKTARTFKSLYKKLEEYNPLLSIEDLDYKFYDDFKKFLFDTPNPNYSGHTLTFDSDSDCYVLNSNLRGNPVGLFDDVVYKYIVRVKTFCKWAKKRGHQVHPSFEEWEVIQREYEPITLTIEELHRIEALDLEGNIDIARDYFVLECRTGQRISDLKRFKKEDLKNNKWIFTQKKGSRLRSNQIELPLIHFTAPALDILQKYNYILPKISEQKINKHIKTICKKAGIDQPFSIYRYAGNKKIRIDAPKNEFISTHTGRKTFITIALQNMEHHIVMEIAGIKDFKTLKHYAGKSDQKNIEKGLQRIEDTKAIMRKAK